MRKFVPIVMTIGANMQRIGIHRALQHAPVQIVKIALLLIPRILLIRMLSLRVPQVDQPRRAAFLEQPGAINCQTTMNACPKLELHHRGRPTVAALCLSRGISNLKHNFSQIFLIIIRQFQLSQLSFNFPSILLGFKNLK